jgi:hypothetical protein
MHVSFPTLNIVGRISLWSVWLPVKRRTTDRKTGVRFPVGAENFPLFTDFRPTLGSTQPPNQRVQELRRPERESHHWMWWVFIFTLRPHFPQGKSQLYPSDRGMGRSQNRSGQCSDEKNPCSCRERIPCQPVWNTTGPFETVTFSFWS